MQYASDPQHTGYTTAPHLPLLVEERRQQQTNGLGSKIATSIPPNLSATAQTLSHGTKHTPRSLPCLYRRRLEAGDDLCGVDAIVAACNKAFGVDTCRCVQHSGDGGCGPSSSSSSSSASPEAAAGDGLDIEVADEVEQAGAILEADGENDPRSPAGSSRLLTTTSSPSSAELTTTFVETEQSVITELEISFTTDEEVSGSRLLGMFNLFLPF